MVLAFNAAMAFVLIPAMGARGAAWAMVATFTLLAGLYYLFLFQELRRLFFDLRSLAAILLALGGALATSPLKDASLPLGMAGYAALGIVLFLAATTGAEKKEMLQALRSPAAAILEVEP
jgi:O-antigen/teichoic acid export membrane protein